ncbi:MAG TPA: translation elongation factor Ts [Myxococcales bacterium]|jgi:elongation factor Ts|nr:translation elongation factor Ts [Myxococcales bacterium]
MAEVTADKVKELREKTGAGMMDCKKALVDNEGDIAKSIEWLRQKGLAKAATKAGRAAAEGAVGSYIHMGGKIGVLVEVNCETDFVARTEDFQQVVKDVAMQIAALSPKYVRREEVPAEEVEKEKEIYRAQLKESGKPEKAWDKIVEGKLDKFFSEVCLLEQPFAKDQNKTVKQMIDEAIAKTGENIQVRRFARFQLGEGLERKKEDLATEIAKMAQG